MTNVFILIKSLFSTIISSPNIIQAIKYIGRYNPNKNEKNKNIIVLGNGPSLEKDFLKIKEIRKDHDVMCMNFFGSTQEYILLKPDYYILIDPLYFVEAKMEKIINLFKDIKENTKWPMQIIVPHEGKSLEPYFGPNRNITFLTFNKQKIRSFPWINNIIYSKGLGVPSGMNVMISALIHSINMRYNKIFIFGADHSWLKNISVGFDNKLWWNDDHFYSSIKVARDYRVALQVESFLTVVESYELVKKFSKAKSEIYNCSHFTMIDNFIRKRPEEI